MSAITNSNTQITGTCANGPIKATGKISIGPSRAFVAGGTGARGSITSKPARGKITLRQVGGSIF